MFTYICFVCPTISFLGIGALLLGTGLYYRNIAKQELTATEEYNHMLRMQMIAEEERRKQP